MSWAVESGDRREPPVMITRRNYLMIRAMIDGTEDVGAWMAREAVSSVALEHEEWDMEELRTWAQWETERTTGP